MGVGGTAHPGLHPGYDKASLKTCPGEREFAVARSGIKIATLVSYKTSGGKRGESNSASAVRGPAGRCATVMGAAAQALPERMHAAHRHRLGLRCGGRHPRR